MKFLKMVLVIIFVLLFCLVSILILFSYLNETNGQIELSGEMRKYLLYVPETYQDGKPTALIISLHGFASWPAQQRNITRFNELADKFSFIVVYPSGIGFPLRWQTSPYGNRDPFVDVYFISDLIDKLSAEYTIDPGHIYVNGFSNGGGLTYLLACIMADRIAAIGTVAGSYDLPSEECNPSQTVPIIAFHGTDDKIVPYGGGFESPPGFSLPAIDNWVQLWAIRNGCNGLPVDLNRIGEVEGVKYVECKGDSEVHFYRIIGGGHSWPGGKPLPEFIVGHTTEDINATELMWSFFEQYELGK